jgi:hypothetical protein
VTCRRIASLTALVAALPLAAIGSVFLVEAALILALANSQVAADFALSRWLFLMAVAICLGASLYLVSSSAYRAVRSWGNLIRFGRQSFTTFGISALALLIGLVFVVVATALGGGFF